MEHGACAGAEVVEFRIPLPSLRDSKPPFHQNPGLKSWAILILDRRSLGEAPICGGGFVPLQRFNFSTLQPAPGRICSPPFVAGLRSTPGADCASALTQLLLGHFAQDST
jgi:hypothetical protein